MLALSQPIAGFLEEVIISVLNGQTVRFRLQNQQNNQKSTTNSHAQLKISPTSEINLLPGTEAILKDLSPYLVNASYCDLFVPKSRQRLLTLKSSTNVQIDVFNSGAITVQRRGFRSKSYLERQTLSQKNQKTTILDLFGLTPSSKVWKRMKQQDALKLLLENSSSQVKDKIKISFSEGYLAGKTLGGASKAFISRFILSILFVSAVCYIIFTNYVSLRITTTNVNQVAPEEVNVTFNDVKGIEEAKDEVMQIVDYLKDPNKYTKLGARLPKGVLLVGPPGCGKTLLAKAIAGEAHVPFFRTSGSEFEEMLVGLGAKRVRDLFNNARARAPCVIFIDEIDSIGSKRSYSVMHPYANQTINQLLTEMDGFLPSSGVIVLAATNRRKDLDPALMRPGRFDVEIKIHVPDLKGRIEIFTHYLDKVKVDPDIDIEKLARGTIGYSAADIENVVNQAALKAATDNKPFVDMHYLDMAQDFVKNGPAKKRLPIDKNTNINTAYHEAGHALVAFFTKEASPIRKVTITPRGESLGHTSLNMEESQLYGQTKAQLQANLEVLMGGRAGEELFRGPDYVTTGTASDLEHATATAKSMVHMFGMSDRAGLRFFGPRTGEYVSDAQLADQTAETLDSEVKRLLSEANEKARSILKTNAAAHKRLADALLQYETLNADDVKLLIEGQPLNKPLMMPKH